MGTLRWARRQPWGVALTTLVVVLGVLVAEPAGATPRTGSYSLTISNPGATSSSVGSGTGTGSGRATGIGAGAGAKSSRALPLRAADLVTAVTISGSTAVVLGGSTPGDTFASSAYVVDKIGNAWHLVDTLTNFGPAGSWAMSAALGEGTLAISWFESSFGGVAIYEKSGPAFHLVADFRVPIQGFRAIGTVATDGSTVMLGDWSYGTGKALVYQRIGAVWRLSQALTNPAPGPGVKFGWSVAISGTTALVGQEYGYGSVYSYREVGGSWILSGNLHPQGAINFGANISLAGGVLVAGGSDGEGAWAFERSAGGWNQYPLSPYGLSPYSGFGAAVAAGTQATRTGYVPLLAVGAPGISAANVQKVQGRVYLYTLEPTSPPVHKTLTAPGATPGDGFGETVALSGDTLLIGQQALPTIGNQSLPTRRTARVYVYTDTKSGWVPSGQLPL